MHRDLHLFTEDCLSANSVNNSLNNYISSFGVTSTKMSGGSPAAGSLMVADYVVFALMLLVSAAVGVYYAWVSRGRGNSKDFLTGSRKLTALPVSMSLTASFMSSTTLLANPAEVRWQWMLTAFLFLLVKVSLQFYIFLQNEKRLKQQTSFEGKTKSFF